METTDIRSLRKSAEGSIAKLTAVYAELGIKAEDVKEFTSICPELQVSDPDKLSVMLKDAMTDAANDAVTLLQRLTAISVAAQGVLSELSESETRQRSPMLRALINSLSIINTPGVESARVAVEANSAELTVFTTARTLTEGTPRNIKRITSSLCKLWLAIEDSYKHMTDDDNGYQNIRITDVLYFKRLPEGKCLLYTTPLVVGKLLDRYHRAVLTSRRGIENKLNTEPNLHSALMVMLLILKLSGESVYDNSYLEVFPCKLGDKAEYDSFLLGTYTEEEARILSNRLYKFINEHEVPEQSRDTAVITAVHCFAEEVKAGITEIDAEKLKQVLALIERRPEVLPPQPEVSLPQMVMAPVVGGNSLHGYFDNYMEKVFLLNGYHDLRLAESSIAVTEEFLKMSDVGRNLAIKKFPYSCLFTDQSDMMHKVASYIFAHFTDEEAHDTERAWRQIIQADEYTTHVGDLDVTQLIADLQRKNISMKELRTKAAVFIGTNEEHNAIIPVAFKMSARHWFNEAEYQKLLHIIKNPFSNEAITNVN